MQCHKECQTAYNKNKLFHFISSFFFQAAQIGSHYEVVYKKSVLQQYYNQIPAKELNFSLKLHASSLQLY